MGGSYNYDEMEHLSTTITVTSSSFSGAATAVHSDNGAVNSVYASAFEGGMFGSLGMATRLTFAAGNSYDASKNYQAICYEHAKSTISGLDNVEATGERKARP